MLTIHIVSEGFLFYISGSAKFIRVLKDVRKQLL